ncbi:PAS domain S-box protein [Deinococcus deserti]
MSQTNTALYDAMTAGPNHMTVARSRSPPPSLPSRCLMTANETPQLQDLELVQLINGIVWEADPVTRVNTFVSDRITSLLGYTPEQWRSPGFWEAHIHPDDQARIVAEGEALMGRGQPYQLEYRMTRADGQTMWLRDLITPVFRGGVMVKLGGVMLDITAEKNAQAELLAARARFSRIIESSPVGMVLSDIKTSRVLETNDAFLRIINCPRAIFMGEEDDFNPWVSADDRAELVRRLKEDRTVRDFETLHKRRLTGEQRNVLISAEYLEMDGQETLLVMAQDITDRKASEMALEESRRTFEALFEHSPDAIKLIDFDTEEMPILQCNKVAARMSGYTREEIIGKSAYATLPDDQRAAILASGDAEFRASLESELEMRFESVQQRKDGSLYPVDINLALLTVGDKRVVLSIERDMTARKKAEAELKSSQERLLLSEKLASLGRLTAGLAHEINTPLAAAMNYLHEAERLAREYQASIGEASVTDDDHREIAGELISTLGEGAKTATRIGEFIRRMREHTRDTVTGVLDFDAGRGAEATLTMLTHQARAANVELIFEAPEQLVVLRGEPGRFTQVVTNLVVNAIHACEGTSQQAGTVTVRLFEQLGHPVLQVQDTGTGISPEVLPKIFDPMFTTKDVGKGTGLGLSIIHDIVTGHFGGEISVQTSIGEGSTFSVSFPRRTRSEALAG